MLRVGVVSSDLTSKLLCDQSGDIWPQYEREEGEEEPDWVKTEREQFNKHRDKDNDGALSKEEISDWISPPDFDHAHAEAKHLIYEADTNKVQIVSVWCVVCGVWAVRGSA